MRWCIRSVFGTEVYQEAGRLLTFTCYITLICVLCISYVCATQNGISIILITCSLWSVMCFPLLTVFALVDNSEFARCWLFKSGRRPPQGGNVWGFCPNVGQTFFEESRSRQTQQSFFHACSALPRSSYHNWATTTSHNHRKVTMAVFRIIYLLFFQGDVIVWLKVGASKCALFFTDIGCGEEVGWMGRGIPDNCLCRTPTEGPT